MSLQNLVGRSLEAVEPDRAAIGRLLAAAERFGQAQQLLADVKAWLAAHKPKLAGA
jgi:hypothetical protein